MISVSRLSLSAVFVVLASTAVAQTVTPPRPKAPGASATTEALARKLGNTLVPSIVQFVPAGNIDPPSGHMKYPGTISLSAATYEALLADIASSLKSTGFKTIVFIGALNTKWATAGSPTRIHFVAEDYQYANLHEWIERTMGIKQVDEGIHDDYAISAIMALVDPETKRLRQGRKIVERRVEETIEGLKKSMAAQK